MPTTMRAWQYTSTTNGLEKNLSISPAVPIPLPTFSPHRQELLIRVLAAALNPADYKVPELGLVARALVALPATPGMDFCGQIIAISSPIEGDDRNSFQGREIVFGRIQATQHGTCGEYIVAPASACAVVPAGISATDAAAIPTVGLTEYNCLLSGGVGPGDKVLINGGSGGAGTAGIQIAKAMGCRVTVTCSGEKAALCRELGADEVIEYTSADVIETLKKGGLGYKLVIDNAGLPEGLYKAADKFLVQEGKYVAVGGPMGMRAVRTVLGNKLWPSFLGGGWRKYELFTLFGQGGLDKLAGWMAEGKLRAVVERVYAFEELPEAVERLKTGRCAGKLVIRVAEEASAEAGYY